MFLHSKGYRLGGLYDLEAVYLTQKKSLSSFFGVDVDFSQPDIPSLGHHFTVFRHPDDWNLNRMFGIDDYFSKCPLPTILLLHWLTRTPLPTNRKTRALLLYTDGLHVNAKTYQKNVRAWMTLLGYDTLLDELEGGLYEEDLQELVTVFRRYGFHPTKKNPYSQCSFKIQVFPYLLPFVEELSTRLGVSSPTYMPYLTPSIQGHRYMFPYEPHILSLLEKKFKENEILSHSRHNLKILLVTFFSPLSKSRDATLVKEAIPTSTVTYSFSA
ncbi:hypothetical protein ACFYKX_10230 [Cytobacillus sp. FJAT-54145]|uniref:Uncharacterized protein n=1 Tax=Cytobacillus spartinae TaxID=3299023 RepID=A0ABW6K9U8_9BACI